MNKRYLNTNECLKIHKKNAKMIFQARRENQLYFTFNLRVQEEGKEEEEDEEELVKKRDELQHKIQISRSSECEGVE